MNIYAYVGNDPVNGSDPTGLATRNSPSCENRIGCASGNYGETSNKKPLSTARKSMWTNALRQQQSQRTNRNSRSTSRNPAPTRAQRFKQGSDVVSGVASAKGVITNVAKQSPGGGAAPLVAGTSLLVAGSAALNASSQIENGKRTDLAIVNAGSRAGAILASGVLLAPETFGMSIVGTGFIAAVDYFVGEDIGYAGEAVYDAHNKLIYNQALSGVVPIMPQ